jgi:hypothetical protein
MKTGDEPARPAEKAADDTASEASVKPFSFPFAPELFSPAKADDKPWHQKANRSNHEQRPGAAPRGTRRSMGKR